MNGIKPILIAVSMYPFGPGSLPSRQITTVGFVGQLYDFPLTEILPFFDTRIEVRFPSNPYYS